MTDEEKEAYVETIRSAMGFELKVDDITDNPVKKQLFKLMLNVSWP